MKQQIVQSLSLILNNVIDNDTNADLIFFLTREALLHIHEIHFFKIWLEVYCIYI